jgi:hypothetical protein
MKDNDRSVMIYNYKEKERKNERKKGRKEGKEKDR